jgi:hypothetical protein
MINKIIKILLFARLSIPCISCVVPGCSVWGMVTHVHSCRHSVSFSAPASKLDKEQIPLFCRTLVSQDRLNDLLDTSKTEYNVPYRLPQDSSPLTRQSQTKFVNKCASRGCRSVAPTSTSLKTDLLSSVACTPTGLRTASLCGRSWTNHRRLLELLEELKDWSERDSRRCASCLTSFGHCRHIVRRLLSIIALG